MEQFAIKLNIPDLAYQSLLTTIQDRILRSRVSPSPFDSYTKSYRCALTDVQFQGQLDSSNTLSTVVFSSSHSVYEIMVYTLHPDVLLRIREGLLCEDEWVVVSPSSFSKDNVWMYSTLKWIMNVQHTMRAMMSISKNVFDMREWRNTMKLALTGDWQSDAAYEIKNKSLNLEWAVDFMTFLWDVKVRPIKFFYSVCYTQTGRSTTRQESNAIWSVTITPSPKRFDSAFADFKSKWWRFDYPAVQVEAGELEFSSMKQAYEALTPMLMFLSKRSENTTMEVDVNLGVRFWNQQHKRFLMTYENF